MSVQAARAIALRTGLRTVPRRAWRPQVNRILARRGYASAQEHGAKSSDTPWIIGALAVTVPGVAYLLSQSPKKSSHGGDHGGHGVKETKEDKQAEAAPPAEEAKEGSEAASNEGAKEESSQEQAATEESKSEESTTKGEEKSDDSSSGDEGSDTPESSDSESDKGSEEK
ncbi:hypothetical protein VTK73DRAFT_9845 [Phialemonium thermophilum]|uniref:Uncharacterized protein n=1 Tax=Phialemonium thermophilum TaxID=223376 RepID=A0ABR3VZX1_9PEZI